MPGTKLAVAEFAAQRTQEMTMQDRPARAATADQTQLKRIGFTYAGVTGAVMLIAAMIVAGQVRDGLNLAGPAQLSALSDAR